MQRKTRSILDELASMPTRNSDPALITENRAMHVIQSAVNLLHYLKETYSPEVAADLEKRLINSIRTSDPNKFVRRIRKVKNENK